jgi:hypothetical protein
MFCIVPPWLDDSDMNLQWLSFLPKWRGTKLGEGCRGLMHGVHRREFSLGFDIMHTRIGGYQCVLYFHPRNRHSSRRFRTQCDHYRRNQTVQPHIYFTCPHLHKPIVLEHLSSCYDASYGFSLLTLFSSASTASPLATRSSKSTTRAPGPTYPLFLIHIYHPPSKIVHPPVMTDV